ncbi:hypothetical protein KRP22_001578 [Phytophthora ramorum]|nr:hypothetical protein KRP22_859 [Phytophthora ramorum]
MLQTLLPPLSPPFAGDKLPSADKVLALLPLSSVIGDSCKTPFDEVDSVGNGASVADEAEDEDSNDDDEAEGERDDELEPADSSEFDAVSRLSELARLVSPLELPVADPKPLSATLPEFELNTKAAVSDDDELLLPVLELDPVLEIGGPEPTPIEPLDVDPVAEVLADVEDASADPLSPKLDDHSDIRPVDPLAPEPDEELDEKPGDASSDNDAESSIEIPEEESALESDEEPDTKGAAEADPELGKDAGTSVTGGGLVGDGSGVGVGAEDALPDPDLESDGGITVTGGGLVGDDALMLAPKTRLRILLSLYLPNLIVMMK